MTCFNTLCILLAGNTSAIVVPPPEEAPSAEHVGGMTIVFILIVMLGVVALDAVTLGTECKKRFSTAKIKINIIRQMRQARMSDVQHEDVEMNDLESNHLIN